MRISFTRRTLAILLIAAVTGAIGTVVAMATIPDGDGMIHACYATDAGGALRVLDPSLGKACGSAETAIAWNQTGPVGPPGPAGSPGAAGPAGPGGPAGPAGGSATVPVFQANTVSLPLSYAAPSRLAVPLEAGSYTVTAHVQGATPGGASYVLCQLDLYAGATAPEYILGGNVPLISAGSEDFVALASPPATAGTAGTTGVTAPMFMSVAGTLPAPGLATLRCNGGATAGFIPDLVNVNVTATRVGSVTSPSIADGVHLPPGLHGPAGGALRTELQTLATTMSHEHVHLGLLAGALHRTGR